MYLIRRNTSVDESYEWDSADACVDSEVLEAMRLDQSHVGLRRGRVEPRHDQAGGLQDQQQKGEPFLYTSSCVMFSMLHASLCVFTLDEMALHAFLLCPCAV